MHKFIGCTGDAGCTGVSEGTGYQDGAPLLRHGHYSNNKKTLKSGTKTVTDRKTKFTESCSRKHKKCVML